MSLFQCTATASTRNRILASARRSFVAVAATNSTPTTTTTLSRLQIQPQPQKQRRSYNTIPIVLESGAMGERSFDIYSRLLRERIICVHGEITDALASVVTAQLLYLEAESPTQPLYMYINSPGGSVTAGLAIYDTMQYIQPAINTIAMGQAASMGSLLLAGGSPGHRYALPNARLMVHQPSGGAQGMASDIQIRATEILRLRQRLNDLYVHHTHQSLQQIERLMDRDSFLDTKQAMELGLIDQVLTQRVVITATNDENENEKVD